MKIRHIVIITALLGQIGTAYGQGGTVTPQTLPEAANPAATPGVSNPGPTNPAQPPGTIGQGPADRQVVPPNAQPDDARQPVPAPNNQPAPKAR
jgi:hypothetical protein